MEMTISENIYSQLDHAKKIASLDPKRSIKISKKLYKWAKQNDLKLEQGHALLNIAFAYRVESDTSGILENAYQALTIFKEKANIIGQVKALNLIGISYFYSSMYDEAMRYFFDGKDLLLVNNNDLLLTSILNNIGEVYRESKLYDRAIEYYNIAAEIACKNKNLLNHGVILGNIGEIYFNKKEFTKALEIYNKSHDILLNTDEIFFLADTENRIGKLYFEMEDFEDAKKYYIKAFKKLKEVNNKYYSIDVLINLAELYNARSNAKTLYFYEVAVNYAKSIGSKKKLCNLFQLISQYYESKNEYKSSLLYYKKYFNINEQLNSLNFKNKLEILNIDIENMEGTGKIEDIRTRLEKEIKRQKYELEKTKISNKLLQKQVYEDELTEVSNRRKINLHLEKILNDKSMNNCKIALFMIDIDKFKKYNDYWGHAQGDVCLKNVANCIKTVQIDRGDIFGRYGGEEFIYISTSIDYKQAFDLGNLIRTEVEKMGLYYIEEKQEKLTTISVGGVIGKLSDFNSSKQIVEAADKELYRAKEMGRNITLLNNII